MKSIRTLVVACAAAAGTAPASAQPEPEQPAPARPAEASSRMLYFPARPAEASSRMLYFRAGAALVAPISSSKELTLADVHGPASLAIHNGPIAGSGASVESATIPAVIIGLVLPFGSRRWSLETILGVPFTVKFKATGTLANMSIAPTALGLPTGVGPLGPELGEAKAVPPLATLVYQLRGDGMLRPYLGAGLAVLFAYDAHATNPILNAVAQPEMKIDPAPGVVAQGGLDIQLWSKVYARFDVKFIGLMNAHAEVRHIQVETPGLPLFEHVEVGTAKMDVTVNPLIVQAGVGVDF